MRHQSDDRHRRPRTDEDMSMAAVRSRLAHMKVTRALREMLDLRDRWDAENVIETLYLGRYGAEEGERDHVGEQGGRGT